MGTPLIKAFRTLLALLVLLPVATYTSSPQAQITKQNGMSFVTWWPGVYVQPDSDDSLANLASTGANWLGLIAVVHQDTITSTSVHPTFPDADLIHVIAEAHRLSMKVMLKINFVVADGTEWGGDIGKGFSEAQWAAWFTSYQSIVNHYAELAQAQGVEQFCIGAELTTTESRENNWRALITQVRQRYNGPITYGANWGSEAGVSWWDAVDYIGVDAYYPLSNKNNPTVQELKTSWQPIVSSLGALSSTWGKPVLFTEFGYRSLDGATKNPGNWQIIGQSDVQEQEDAYRAFFEVVYGQSWFAGMYWWTWTPDPLEGSLCDTEFTPHGKPAENILRMWFGAPLLPDPGVPPTPDNNKVLYVYTDDLGYGWDNWSYGTSTLDLAATNQVFSGTHSISASLQAWGAISLHHYAVTTAPYYWLEFYVRESVPSSQLIAKVNDENDTELRPRPVYDCRYIEGSASDLEIWRRVRIPLSHLNARNRQIVRITIQNWSNTPSSLWLDEIRLVGADFPHDIYLPMVQRDN